MAAAAMSSPTDLLRQVPLFEELSESHLESLASACRWEHVVAGQTLLQEGAPGDSLMILVDGHARVEREGRDGRSLVVAQRGPGEPVGELALLDGGPRSATVVAAEPMQVMVLPREAFLSVLHSAPSLAVALLACLSRSLRRATDQVDSLHELLQALRSAIGRG
jgi:CRP-like cAMP-binding protein